MTVSAGLRALAKINLDLRVLGRRPDGFHELRTVFQTISLEDSIAVHALRAPQTHIEIAGNIPIEDNLIARAARLVLEESGASAHLRFELHKRIPMGAGLGGGSSDAATVLLALPGLLGVTVSPERLHTLAAALGSDVPFFLHGGTALGLGRGEELYPLPALPDLPGLLVAPPIHVGTADAYRALSGHLASGPSPDSKRAQFAQFCWTGDLSLAQNDFEEPVFAQHPALAAIRETLAREGAVCARMTGSGSSLFGLFPNPALREQAQASLAEYPTYPFALVSRKQYQHMVSATPLPEPAA